MVPTNYSKHFLSPAHNKRRQWRRWVKNEQFVENTTVVRPKLSRSGKLTKTHPGSFLISAGDPAAISWCCCCCWCSIFSPLSFLSFFLSFAFLTLSFNFFLFYLYVITTHNKIKTFLYSERYRFGFSTNIWRMGISSFAEALVCVSKKKKRKALHFK